MNVKDYLLDEIKRLNRLNDRIEKNINTGGAFKNEPEQIICNVEAMCDIADIMYKYQLN